jgi:LAO/AO transport system kinase
VNPATVAKEQGGGATGAGAQSRAREGGIDIRRVARALSLVENRRPEAVEMLREAYRLARAVPVIGITGPPGAGKSTLLDRLTSHWADAGDRVAVIVVDPSSPYTGGALLGDRFRMDRASAHPNVFVRSLSSRGHVGGLSRAVQDVVVMLGTLDFDLVIVETVGSGQSDIEIAQLADCVVVVSVPGLGDQIQAAKAGILEIGDVYAVNKSDTPGAETVAHMKANLDLIYPGQGGVNESEPGRNYRVLPANAELHARHGTAGKGISFWRPPVLRLSAGKGEGISELGRAIDEFLSWQRDTGRDSQRRGERLRSHILRVATARLLDQTAREDCLQELVQAVASGSSTPDDAAQVLLDVLCRRWPPAPGP